MNQETVEAGIAAGGTKLTVAGSAGAVVGGLTHSEIGVWGGILIGLLGLLVKLYFECKADRRREEAHKAYMESLGQIKTPDSAEDSAA